MSVALSALACGPAAGKRAGPDAMRLDGEADRAFRRELADRVTGEQLIALGDILERKAQAMTALVAAGPEPDRVPDILRLVFATRRGAAQITALVGSRRLAAAIGTLVRGDGPVAERFDEFETAIGTATAPAPVGRALSDLPGELLRFTSATAGWPVRSGQPARAADDAAEHCQLWSRWMWDPATGTGALPLLIEGDIGAGVRDSRGAQYRRVCQAAAQVGGPGPFGTELILAGVYGIYLHTVLRLRLTAQFGSVLPQVPELIGRLLGAGRG